MFEKYVRIYIGVAFLLISQPSRSQPIYKDPKQSIDVRVTDLLGRMSIEEKFFQLFMIPGDLRENANDQYKNGLFGFQVSAAGPADAGGQILNYNTSESASTLVKKINEIQKYFVEKTRLGIPLIFFDEALHGLVRANTTVFPQAIALAATWDTLLMGKIANQIAAECRARGIRQILSPVVNLATDPRWGRTEETYGEDPFLTTEMAVAFVKQFEKTGIITTPKHFVANVGEGGRDSYPIHFNERYLEESHFIPFKACIQRGGSRSIMTAYNSIDGTAASANSWLLNHKLKNEWQFRGFVISDANAVGGELVLHNTAKDYGESGMHAINGGLDVIFQTEFKHHELFFPAVNNNNIDTSRLNDAVSRVLRAKFELGLFENPYVEETPATTDPDLARKASRESIVLLKNEKNTLPIQPSVRSIAIIGQDAVEARLGGYSGPGENKVNILTGIKSRAPKNTLIRYHPGVTRNEILYKAIPDSFLFYNNKQGLQADYFVNLEMNGNPTLSRIDKQIDFHWTLYGPSQNVKPDYFSVRWAGVLKAPVTGKYKIGLEGNDGYRLFIDNKLVVDKWGKQSYHQTMTDFIFVKGKQYAIRIEFFETNGNGRIKLLWNVGVKDNTSLQIQEASKLAKNSDLVIIVAGINEGEFSDRAVLKLPGRQEDLINEIVRNNKPVIVLLSGGSAITMENWLDKVNAVAMTWYPGEQGGNAIADILFGDYSPAGRLPITFPMHEGQLPLVYNHKPTGRGDDYNNLSGQPLFPFGFGLSYTSFSYENFSISNTRIESSKSCEITGTIRNTGNFTSDEVVQLYIKDILASVARPVMELKGFQRIRLKPGESRKISFTITKDLLMMLDKDLKPVVESGFFQLMIGASSKDIRWKGEIEIF